ncbi:hypothetical protein EI94DRAFT_1705027 [Lactarius quietus]|nr:hypothetical protein EI94DRAFT_1705027 [Lactarius quietus]
MSYYPTQGKLQAYYSAPWARAGLQSHMRYGMEVVCMMWDATVNMGSQVLRELEHLLSHSKACDGTLCGGGKMYCWAGIRTADCKGSLGRGDQLLSGPTVVHAEKGHLISLVLVRSERGNTLSRGDIVLTTVRASWRKCTHKHWKNCQDYPEVHTWVLGQPEYCEEEEADGWPEVAEEDYVEEDEALHIGQLILAEALQEG